MSIKLANQIQTATTVPFSPIIEDTTHIAVTADDVQEAIDELSKAVKSTGKEDTTNKVTDLSASNNTTYPTTQAVKDAIIELEEALIAIPVAIPTDIIDNLASTSATSALSANQGKILNDSDILSGALIGTDLVLTKKDNTTIAIDATAMLADVRVSSGVYNSTTKTLDFTLSDSSIISVPVSALLPVTHDNTLSGDGSTTPLKIELSADINNLIILGTDGKLYGSSDINKMNKTTGATTGGKVLLSSGTAGTDNVESTTTQAWLESNHSAILNTYGTVADANPDGSITNAVANWGYLNDGSPINDDRLYFADIVNNINKTVTVANLKTLLADPITNNLSLAGKILTSDVNSVTDDVDLSPLFFDFYGGDWDSQNLLYNQFPYAGLVPAPNIDSGATITNNFDLVLTDQGWKNRKLLGPKNKVIVQPLNAGDNLIVHGFNQSESIVITDVRIFAPGQPNDGELMDCRVHSHTANNLKITVSADTPLVKIMLIGA